MNELIPMKHPEVMPQYSKTIYKALVYMKTVSTTAYIKAISHPIQILIRIIKKTPHLHLESLLKEETLQLAPKGQ